MSNRKDKEKRPEPKVLNPRYAGATPEDVGRALLRAKPEAKPVADDKDDDED